MPSDNVMLVGTLIPIVAILVGGLLLAIPIAGLTLRFAIKPALETLGQFRERRGQEEELRLLEQRLSLLEEQFHARALATDHPPVTPPSTARDRTIALPRSAANAPEG